MEVKNDSNLFHITAIMKSQYFDGLNQYYNPRHWKSVCFFFYIFNNFSLPLKWQVLKIIKL